MTHIPTSKLVSQECGGKGRLMGQLSWEKYVVSHMWYRGSSDTQS